MHYQFQMNINSNVELIKKLASNDKIGRDEWLRLLTSLNKEEREYLRQAATSVAASYFGRGVYVRGLIEISSYCRNNCNYCGLRCSNAGAERYRLAEKEILECCEYGAGLGFNTFVLQGGEDPKQNDGWIASLVAEIHSRFPDKAITLSVGERSTEAYKAFRSAGADRYLLRHETRNDEHYSALHPMNMSAENRRKCLAELKRLRFQTGTGMMIGSPGQSWEHLAEDLVFIDELQPEMIGIGPFIPAKNTPFENYPPGSVETTLLLISLLRLRHPKALIPATTALATLNVHGRANAILAGVNVVMPNLSPATVRAKYSIYDNKAGYGCESAEGLMNLEAELKSIGYHIDFGRGDYK